MEVLLALNLCKDFGQGDNSPLITLTMEAIL